MPQDQTADLTSLFQTALNDPDEPKEPQTEEGDSPAQPEPATGKETTGQEVAPAPQTESQDEHESSEKDDRYQELLEEVKRLKKYEPLIEVFEAEPDVARQVLAHKLGIQQAPQPARVEPAPTAPSPQDVENYWRTRIETDPASTIRDLINMATTEATRGSKNASSRVLINDYKSRRRSDDPMFAHYEPYFDMLAKTANPDFVIDYPDETLGAVENLALGTWAREQRAKAIKAKTTETPKREKPRSLEVSKVTTPVQPAKKRRELNDEERHLANIYGEEALDLDDESETPWR